MPAKRMILLCFVLPFFGGAACGSGTPAENPDVRADTIGDISSDTGVLSDPGVVKGDISDSVAGDVRDVVGEIPVPWDAAADCDPLTPHLVNGKCVQCRNCGDCPAGRPVCHPLRHQCEWSACGDGTHFCAQDCQCHECCDDGECIRIDGTTGICGPDGTCVGVTACSDSCGADIPICARYDGANHCVECAVDADCEKLAPGRGCRCADEPVMACVDDDGRHCLSAVNACASQCGGCTGCPKVPNLDLRCGDIDLIGNGGTCFDSKGSCDGVNGCCAAGMNCFDLTRLFISGVMGRIPGVPVDLARINGGRFCECATAADCRSGLACTDTSELCAIPASDYPVIDLICPGGQMSPHFPARLCAHAGSVSDWAMSLSAVCTEDEGFYGKYGICSVANGIKREVRCLTDVDCVGSGADCRCVKDIYACIGDDGRDCDCMCCGDCTSTCEDVGDCPPTADGGSMICATLPAWGWGVCVNPDGTCGDGNSCCAPGARCNDMNKILQDIVWPDLCEPLLMVPVNRTYCGCDSTEECLNGKECTDVSAVCDIKDDLTGFVDALCPGGTLDPRVPTKICGTMDEFLFGHVKLPQ